MNNNFGYLDDRITEVDNKIYANNASLESKISTVNANLLADIEDLSEGLENSNTSSNSTKTIVNNLVAGGLYTNTYVNGESGYREYFTDSAKKNRVLMIQWGKQVSFSTCYFPKAFKVKPSVVASAITTESCVSSAFSDISVTSFYIRSGTHGGRHEDRYNIYSYWIAIGK